VEGILVARTVVWFSCGAASAVAARLTLETTPDAIVARCIVANEHPDNDRFASDVARWLGVKVVELRSYKYADCWDVWERRGIINTPHGSPCTLNMKKRVRQAFEEVDDIQIFGYTVEEQRRCDLFRQHNPEILARFPLVTSKVTKADCFRILQAEGIELPAMYRLGYSNSNCIGCPRGPAPYWNKIRRDFPEVFERMAALEERLGCTVLGDTTLRDLDPEAGRFKPIDIPECGLFCGSQDITLLSALAKMETL
jgi:3'-phosphoadenosine 5'-phosphosulfate sulfotransferase (PAPS reductase)/FAD synthetase